MSITVGGIKFQIEFSFLVFSAMMFLIKDGDVIRNFLLTCMLHEFGHAAALFFSGGHLAEVVFSGIGIKMIPKRQLISVKREVFILLAGPVVNIVIFSLDTETAFGVTNLLAAIFNLLPFSFLDGGSILNLLFGIRYNGKFIMTAIRAIPVTLSVALVLKFGTEYVSIMCVMLFYFVSDLMQIN